MPQIFHPSMNTLSRVTIFGALFMLAVALWLLLTIVRSPYATSVGVIKEQPVPFSHKHHVADAGIDCRYCHTSVEDGPFAGIPPTQTCMNCHSQIWTTSPMLEPVRASFRDDVPLVWNRVYDLPDYAYFDHSAHVNNGVGCASCHGRIDTMEVVYQHEPLSMGWCLDCHRSPENNLRPIDQVTNMAYQPPTGEAQSALGRDLRAQHDINPPTDCSTCHR
jgi:hypothetical protein